MSDSYAPRAGSAQGRIIDLLRSRRGAVATGEIAERCEITSGVGAAMKPLIENGLVVREGAGTSSAYRLADAPPQDSSPAALQIAAYNDGDVHVVGVATTDEGVMFTRGQLEQLFAFLTRAPLPMTPAPAAQE